jgi:hypothetical protein
MDSHARSQPFILIFSFYLFPACSTTHVVHFYAKCKCWWLVSTLMLISCSISFYHFFVMNFLPRVTIFILVVPKPFVLLLLLPPNTANIRTSSNESWQESENDFFFYSHKYSVQEKWTFCYSHKNSVKATERIQTFSISCFWNTLYIWTSLMMPYPPIATLHSGKKWEYACIDEGTHTWRVTKLIEDSFVEVTKF